MVLGKHSGRNAFRSRLDELGITFESETELNAIFQRFKELADKKHEIFDEDIQALVSETVAPDSERVKLISLKVTSETGETPVARMTLCVDDEEKQVEMGGSGPVDAAFRAIEEIVHSQP
jgi:2-isopropylmalate synthase